MALSSYLHYWWTATAVLVLPVIAIIVHDIILWKRMPPEPTPVPFMGNKKNVPRQDPWIKFQEWSKKYGLRQPNSKSSLPALACPPAYYISSSSLSIS
jgi:hypothetical protein